MGTFTDATRTEQDPATLLARRESVLADLDDLDADLDLLNDLVCQGWDPDVPAFPADVVEYGRPLDYDDIANSVRELLAELAALEHQLAAITAAANNATTAAAVNRAAINLARTAKRAEKLAALLAAKGLRAEAGTVRLSVSRAERAVAHARRRPPRSQHTARPPRVYCGQRRPVLVTDSDDPASSARYGAVIVRSRNRLGMPD